MPITESVAVSPLSSNTIERGCVRIARKHAVLQASSPTFAVSLWPDGVASAVAVAVGEA